MYKKNQLLFSVFCVLSLSFFSYAKSYAKPMIVAGNYWDNYIVYPLLASSQNDGETWKYTIKSDTPLLPTDFNNGHFSSSSCSGLHCVAVGNYYKPNVYNFNPLVANSIDGGKTWAYTLDSTKPDLPPDFQNGMFNAVSCSGVYCVAVGLYYVDSQTTYPLVANSTDQGVSWTYTLSSSSPSLPPSNVKGGALSDVNCTGLRCITVGTYNGGFPLILRSGNGGSTWDYSLDQNTLLSPSDVKGGHLSSTSCGGTHCIAVGNYITDANKDHGYGFPLIAQSEDGGVNWSYTLDGNQPILPAEYSYGQLVKAQCSQLNCVAVGYYFDTHSIAQPLLVNSADGGKTWSYPNVNKSLNLPSDYKHGHLYAASCSKSHCIAVGTYSNGSTDFPLVIHSKDGGITWDCAVNSTTPQVPNDFKTEGNFYGAECSGLHCMAAGLYNNYVNLIPLLARSEDGGATWTYQIDSTRPELPADFSTGGFSSPAIASTLHLSPALSFLNK